MIDKRVQKGKLDDRIFSGEDVNSKGGNKNNEEKGNEKDKPKTSKGEKKEKKEIKKIKGELRGMEYYEQVYEPSIKPPVYRNNKK